MLILDVPLVSVTRTPGPFAAVLRTGTSVLLFGAPSNRMPNCALAVRPTSEACPDAGMVRIPFMVSTLRHNQIITDKVIL